MKFINNKNILVLLMTLMLIILAILSFYSYQSYVEYRQAQKSTKNTFFLNTVNKVLYSIDEERDYSAIYMGTKGKSEFQKIEKSRDNLDIAMKELDDFIITNKEFGTYEKRVKFAVDNLKYVRTRVDSLSNDYENIFFDSYQDKVRQTLIGIITSLSTHSTTEEIKNYLALYAEFEVLKSNSALEKTFIAFVLSRAERMSEKDLLLWDKIVSQDNFPSLANIENKIVLSRLKNTLDIKTFQALSKNERVDVFYGVQRGMYPITTMKWIEKLKKKIEYLNAPQNILLFEIEKYAKNNIKQIKDTMLQYAIAALIFFVLLLVLIVVYFNINKDKKLFEDTLKDIETVLSLEQQEELKSIIERRDTKEIYAFLVKTIKDANETKDLFLANMSHEIRTPLNGIVGFTQLLKYTEMSEEQEEFIGVIENSSDNLLTIVNDILDLSKIKAEKIELENISFNPVEKFESSVESYAARAAEKNVEFSIFVDPELPTSMRGDPTKVSQVLVNLISNAIKFTEESGKVDVLIAKVAESENYTSISFSITDTGIGITEDQQKKIFEAFSQADISTSRKFGGTGLGLAISAKFVNLMGGKLEVRSEQNKGSTFYFTLNFEKTEDAKERETPNMSSLNVGIVVPNSNTAIEMNRNLGCYIDYTEAEHKFYVGDELLKIESSKLPQILFIDYMYFKRKGELEKYLNLDTKVVLIVAGNQKRNIEMYEDKVDRILYKPINLTKTIKSLEVAHDIEKIWDTTEDKEQIEFQNIHVLVAEDNTINQKLIKSVLNGLGAEVTLANDGQEALHLRKENKYDIIFMDIQMPIMGGIEATEKMIEYEKDINEKHVPIIALTANALKGDREKYLNAGMDNYLSKPLDLEKINLVMQEYLSRNIKRKEVLQEESVATPSKPEQGNKLENKKIIQKTEKNKIDILLYHSMPLVLNIYKGILENLSYSVEVVTDEHVLLDKLETTQYTFVIYDTVSLNGMECMIADIVKDSGAKPYMLVAKDTNIEKACADYLHVGMNHKEIANKLII